MPVIYKFLGGVMNWKILLAQLLICGCASSSGELTPTQAAIDIYTEKPECAYESLGSVDSSSAASRRVALKRVLGRAESQGATGIIIDVESSGAAAPGTYATYSILAIAIRCVE